MNRPDEHLVAGLTCGEVLAVLSDFLDGELEPVRREQIVGHIRGCDWCERFGGRFAAIIESLRATLSNAEPLPSDVASRLRNRLREAQEE